MHKIKLLLAATLAVTFAMGTAGNARAAAKEYEIAWSHYTGWEPWQYIQDSGIMKKWGDKYGVSVKITLVNDYVESINNYTSGKFAGCAMTNMDALTIPSVGGIDSTALIVGDFSNGNDGIVLKNGTTVADLKGREALIVQFTVSHYLLARALDMNKMQERDMKLRNVSDADIASLFTISKDPHATVVTWNPQLMQVRAAPGATMVFDSSKIPGEIIDLMVVRTNMPDTAKKAICGAWYEAMGLMSSKDKAGKEAVSAMAKSAGGTLAEFEAQLRTTRMFYTAKEAAEFARDQKLKQTMEYVRGFVFDHKLFGDAANKDFIGIQFPDGSIAGDPNLVKFRFVDTFMQQTADGK